MDKRLANPKAEPRRLRNPRGQGERLREEIMAAAEFLLAESHDTGQLSLRGVAKQAGIAATSVYLHFPDVDHLKVALVERGFTELNVARDAASEKIDDPEEALLVRVRAYCQFALAHPGRYRLMFGPDLPPTLAYDVAMSPTYWALQTLIHSIERCQEKRGARPGNDPVRVATMLWAALHGLVLLRMDRPRFPWPPLDETINELVRRLVGFGAVAGRSC